MQWPNPLCEGLFQRRYKRFFADLQWTPEGPVEVAHVANTGSLKTAWPNVLAAEAFNKKLFSHWLEFDEMVREFSISKETRLDLRLRNSKNNQQHFVEVKNVTLREGRSAQFPDSVTKRGQKHLRELVHLREQGHGAEILFAVQRTDVEFFSPARSIDPDYGRELDLAAQAGVVISARVLELSPQGMAWSSKALEVRL
jgi:sugar fermentation stimulation protein A